MVNSLDMKKNDLYYIAAVLWGIPGVIISVKGVRAYLTMPTEKLWWLLLITVFVLIGFFFMFRGAVDKYSAHIASQSEKTNPLKTFPVRGWLLIIFMLGLGMALKFIPGIPDEFIASFYSGVRCCCLQPAASSTTDGKTINYIIFVIINN